MASQDEQAKLDAALDAALDELDSSDEDEDGDEENERFDPSPQIPSKPAVSSAPSSKLLSAPPVQMGPPRPPASTTTSVLPDDDRSAEKLFAIMMQQLVEGEGGSGGGGERLSGEEEDEFMERLMQEMQTQLAQMEAPTTSATKPKKQMSPATSKAKASSAKRRVGDTTSSPSTTGKDEVEAAISSLVEGLAKQVTMDDDEMEEVGQAPESDNDMLNRLMEGLAEGMAGGEGGDFNPDAVIDGMMEQLLSKDLMYDPMKQVATKFPGWLNEHRSTLSAEEYAERRKQCDCFCKLVQVYETEPNNVAKLMELMQEVQEYGQPPVEIIQEIAPGIELDDEGMPKLDGSGLPFGGNEECRVM